jgi:nitroreductase
MEVLDIIKERRSVRSYTEEPVDEDKLNKLVEAAVWAPSGGNIQAWTIVILQQKEIIEEIKAVSPGIIGNPTALMVLCADRAKAYNKGENWQGIHYPRWISALLPRISAWKRQRLPWVRVW